MESFRSESDMNRFVEMEFSVSTFHFCAFRQRFRGGKCMGRVSHISGGR